MSLAEFSKYCEQHDTIDRELDDKQVQILKKGNVLLEGRLAGWLAVLNEIPSFKIWIDADPTIRAERIVNREGGTVSNQLSKLSDREKSERSRYEKYYHIDITDTSIYDIIIDSSQMTPKMILSHVLHQLKQKNKNQ
jgi:predicted cytidylate kinase